MLRDGHPSRAAGALGLCSWFAALREQEAELMGERGHLPSTDVLQSGASTGWESSASDHEMQMPAEVLSHNSTEELKLKAMFNQSNTYQRTTTSCVCYTLAEPSHWEKGISSSRGGSVHAGCGNGQEGNV